MKIFPLLPVPYINVDFLSRRLRFDIAWNIYLGNDVCYIAVNLSQFPHNLSHHLPVRDCYNPEIASESLPHNVCYRRTKDSTVASPRELEYLKLEFMNTKLLVWNWFYWWIMELPNVDGKLASHLWAWAPTYGNFFVLTKTTKFCDGFSLTGMNSFI